eukprot:CAMPEP_0116889318 /NCGR_PEP_ID=MMETSP0463-20121206/24734_1 /TAXON_ID=181622 /ORGANISM="Strombidinopsis sp, Strain SopsisLIS2011" /LENGTH=62 /DNA_ID=CAMNT_0004555751 /DNA_START=483 /DNA_END=672 /DNA_ORIENTATION=+
MAMIDQKAFVSTNGQRKDEEASIDELDEDDDDEDDDEFLSDTSEKKQKKKKKEVDLDKMTKR